MSDYQFICKHHQRWVNNNHAYAFIKLVTLAHEAKQLALTEGWQTALPHIGTAYETADILFTANPQSAQVATMFSSMTLLLSEAFGHLACYHKAEQVLSRAQQKLGHVGKQFKTLKYQHCINCLGQALKKLNCTAVINHSASIH